MTDKQLLELAAKAAGIVLRFDSDGPTRILTDEHGEIFRDWNPLTDDGDALRLAVKLRLEIVWHDNGVTVQNDDMPPMSIQHLDDDPYQATRRAIVRAASDIGKSMESTSQPSPAA